MTLEERVREAIALMEKRLPKTLTGRPHAIIDVYMLLTDGVPFKPTCRTYKRPIGPKVVVTSTYLKKRFGIKS